MQRVGNGCLGIDDVFHLEAAEGEGIGQIAAVAAFVAGFGAHDGDELPTREARHPLEGAAKVAGHHVIGIAAERIFQGVVG